MSFTTNIVFLSIEMNLMGYHTFKKQSGHENVTKKNFKKKVHRV